ncbi:histidine phosphatase family protein [Solicola sp. PLA-1-18]|uniref:histidine phosphatase family protein n=1 Tax=Solicola sp. PLA-1-18 TaxID=3380532 RepID=UPI003B75EDA1
MTDAHARTVVHLVRHGEVYNPTGVLYGRLPGYVLSDLGHQMAERVGEWFSDRDVTHLVASPLERAQQTVAPTAKLTGLPVTTDERVIEAGNQFEGKIFGVGDGALRHPSAWWKVRNPFKPSWGEPYREIADRMLAAMADARDAARGHEAAIVSHQLPVWTARMAVEGRRFAHDPRKRQCSLASVTSVTYEDDAVVAVAYNEPAGDLIPAALRKKFVGGA